MASRRDSGKDFPSKKSASKKSATAAFLLAQVGAHAAAKFAARLSALELGPPHAGILRAIGASAGLSQQALSSALSILPSRLVALLDELESRGLVERRNHPEDRRTYALYLTGKGDQTLEAIGRLAREHQDSLLAALNETERDQLTSLLLRVAEQQGLTPGVHPGFSRI